MRIAPSSRIRRRVLKALVLLAAWVVASTLLAVTVPNVPVGGTRSSAAEGMVVGAVHMHTLESDGSGTVDDLVDAALANGLDFIVVTDHNTRRPTSYEYRRGVLLVHGEEFSSVFGHVLMLDVDTVRVSEADSVDLSHGLDHHRDLDDAGVRIAAHPSGRRFWRDRTASELDGIEVWNADSEWRNDGPLDWIEALALLPLRPPLGMLALVDRPSRNLALLDSASVGRTLATTCAVDAHARIPITDDWIIRFPTYRMTLGLVHQHLPMPEPLTGEADVDGPRLVDAIRRGGGHCAIGGIADDGAVRIERTERGITVALPGDVPRPRIRVYRGGTLVREAESRGVEVATPEPGMYRVEVDVRARLLRPRWLPWILSAPIWVGPSPDDPPSDLLGTFEDDYGNRYTITPEAWVQEPDVRYEVDAWHGSKAFVVARNGADNLSDAGLWTRIDWVELPPAVASGSEGNDPASGGARAGDHERDWAWGFCLSTWSAPTRSDARRSVVADRSDPRSGCGGYPFSRMRRVQ